jgi:hypothetical protein
MDHSNGYKLLWKLKAHSRACKIPPLGPVVGHFAALHHVAPAKLAVEISVQKFNSAVDRLESMPVRQRNTKRSSDISSVPPRSTCGPPPLEVSFH